METQSLQEKFAKYSKETIGGVQQRPIGCYSLLLVFALLGLFALHLILTAFLLRLNLTGFLPVLNPLFAILYSWMFSGLGVCLLLYLWLKFKYAAVVVTLALVILWGAGLARYVRGEGSLPIVGGVVFLLSLVAGGAIFLRGLYVVSGFLLPLPDESHRGKVFNFLRDYASHVNFPAYVVVDELSEEDKVEKRVPGNMFSQFATSPGFVLTGCDHAVAISDGLKFKGVKGPGVVFTGFSDQVVRTIDLRPQLRAFPVEALTKDGIKIRVLAFTPFKIDARGREPRLGEPLPYNKGAAFRAVHAQKMEHEDGEKKQCSWDDLPRMIAERTLQNTISEYNFDDLYGPYQPGGEPPRKVIARRFREQVAAELEPLGIHLIGGGISDLEPADPQVYVERVRSWQADWARKIMLRQAEGQAEWLRIVERARAEAQADLILSLGRQLEELSTARTELCPETALKLLVSVLEGLMRQQPTLGRLVPGETLQALIGIREAITE